MDLTELARVLREQAESYREQEAKVDESIRALQRVSHDNHWRARYLAEAAYALEQFIHFKPTAETEVPL